ncbi:MAG: DUF1592 domain-containing protein [Pirellula sp.]
MRTGRIVVVSLLLVSMTWWCTRCHARQDNTQPFQREFTDDVKPLLARYCSECHVGQDAQAEVDLSIFREFDDVRKHTQIWVKVREMLDSEQMPPKEAKQLNEAERTRLQTWVRDYLTLEASAQAGDPGRVVLRRLNNAEYNYTIRDLTGVASLEPAREFPADSAAGEGFTNTGNALVMSPALVTKYLDAAKGVADHAVLTPNGIRFSPSVNRRDWTEECLGRIRDFYRTYSNNTGSTSINLQGIKLDTNQGGRLPLENYLRATLAARESQSTDLQALSRLATERHLSAKYLTTLFQSMSQPTNHSNSLVMNRIRRRWLEASTQDASAIASEVSEWQKSLWKFNVIGHVIRDVTPANTKKSWLEPADPFVEKLELRQKLTPAKGAQQDSLLCLSVMDAGDGNEHDWVVWDNPRLVAPGRADLALRDIRESVASLPHRRERVASSAAKCLEVASRLGNQTGRGEISSLAHEYEVEESLLKGWLSLLGISAEPFKIDSYLTKKMESAEGYKFISGWVGNDALSIVANSSDQHVRIPGNMKPHSIAVHPTPKLRVNVGWRSPITETIQIEGSVQHAHPECGNGVQWSLELRRGNVKQRLATGAAQGGTIVPIASIRDVMIRDGDLVVLSIGPKDGNHSCDLTALNLTIKSQDRQWDLASDNSDNILEGNPHADRFGHVGVWNFFSEPDNAGSQPTIPVGSLLDRWMSATSNDVRGQLGVHVQTLLQNGPQGIAGDSADVKLYEQLMSMTGPLVSTLAHQRGDLRNDSSGEYGLDPALFGKHPLGGDLHPNSLCVKAPSTLEFRLPQDLSDGYEFVVTGTLHPSAVQEGSVQLQLSTSAPKMSELSPALPIVIAESGNSRKRFEIAMNEMRSLFPAALCYEKIVPVDEVVTLTLFYREDDQLQRLLLDDEQIGELNRLWDELLYVSQEPLLLVSAFEQLAEYATQDRPDKVTEFAPLRKPILDRADRFRSHMIATEPLHVDAVLSLGTRAFRRGLTEAESQQLRNLYSDLRRQELGHEEAIRLTIARTLVTPSFLYRIERPKAGSVQHPVTDLELATRLSYFLWSSLPDDELIRIAKSGELHRDDVLVAQTQRMLRDPKAKRLAIEFAGQWLHIRDFEAHDQKSERQFPTFLGLRSAMFEESTLFFDDLFRNNRSILSILDADHTFLNEELAKHYGIPNVQGEAWQRVDGVGKQFRGGILTHASTLATQSGASRTSPILRGNWISEVLLGERLPRPPKNVPVLPESPPEGLTERELIARHTSDAACAKCHVRIDPMGFALENFDAIGRYRELDMHGLAIDAKSQLMDGTQLDGLAGLRGYLTNHRRKDFLRQFNRKLLGYALGRSVQLSDEPFLDELDTVLKQNDFRFHALIKAVVKSRPFREIRGLDSPNE